VASGDGTDLNVSVLAREGRRRDEALQKMKRSQRAYLDFMGRKCDMMQWCDDVDRRRGGIREEKERRQC
jgi:hypothetical protein